MTFGAWLRRHPIAFGAGVGLGLIALRLGLGALFNESVLRPAPDELTSLISAVLVALLIGYSWGAHRYSEQRDAEDMAALAPVFRAPPRARASRAALRSGETLLWLGLGVAFTLLVDADLAPGLRSPPPEFESVWNLLTLPALFAALGRTMSESLRDRREEARRIEAGLHIDLLDLEPLAPFGRLALRNAVLWLAGSTLALLFLLVPEVSALQVIPLVALILVVAMHSFVQSLLPVRRQVQRAKRDELARLNAQIRADRDRMQDGFADAAARLPGLLSYRSFVEGVREWPLDTPALARFALYLGIPIAGWLGGAIVEQLLSAAIDSGALGAR